MPKWKKIRQKCQPKKKTIANQEEEIYEPVKAIAEGYEEGKTTTEDLMKVKE